ncbi:MAG TPA: hypothetical protein DGO89_01185 [Microcoleaceae bacterium UBA9251]|nr:hypothetical protein [Microcoleaceae cyanobacterium UBA9251]
MKTLLSIRQGTRTDNVRDTPRAFATGILGSPTQLAFNSLQNQTQLLYLPKRFASCQKPVSQCRWVLSTALAICELSIASFFWGSFRYSWRGCFMDYKLAMAA